ARQPAVGQRGEETADDWRRRLLRQLADQLELARRAEALDARADERFTARWGERRQAILWESLEADLDAAAAIEAARVESYFAEHAREFDRPETITTRLILRKLARDAGGQAWEAQTRLLEAARERVLAGEPFGALAREFSQAENAARGGAVQTSPRGTLLQEFESVAWSLAPGEVSQVVRLPDGAALILLERRNPARTATLETARRPVERRLREARRREFRGAAVAESCGEETPALDARELALALEGGGASVRLGAFDLDLASLELDPHAPWWAERLQAAVESACLDRTAVGRGLAGRPEVAARLAVEERGLLAAWATDRELATCGRAVSERELEAFYADHAASFHQRERRRFQALTVPVASGGQRIAQAQAVDAADAWRKLGAPPAGAPTETWGPLDRAGLAGLTSPRLAGVAFALAPGEVSDAILLERFSPARANFEAKGYVALRLEEVEPEAQPPLSEVSERIRRFLSRGERVACLEALLGEVTAQAPLTIDEPALGRCPLEPEPEARAAGSRALSPSE
ncbi:MAG: peptidylprolyl isomerase, partial [Thermoanaerobaculia bacterium]